MPHVNGDSPLALWLDAVRQGPLAGGTPPTAGNNQPGVCGFFPREKGEFQVQIRLRVLAGFVVASPFDLNLEGVNGEHDGQPI